MNSSFQIHSYWAQNKWVTILWSYSRLCYDYDTDFNQNSTLVCILYWNGEGNQFWFASCFELICWDCNIVWWLGSRFRSNISNISIKKCTFHYKWFNGVRLSWGQIKISELPEKICSKTQTKGNTEYQVMMIITEILDHISMRRNVDGLLELISLWNWLHQSIMCQNKSQIFSV